VAELRPAETAFGQLEYPTPPETATAEDVIASALAHHRRQAEAKARPPAEVAPVNSGYNPESLSILFGGRA
jgi:hypothetical protein